jgi:hypothetical protein
MTTTSICFVNVQYSSLNKIERRVIGNDVNFLNNHQRNDKSIIVTATLNRPLLPGGTIDAIL